MKSFLEMFDAVERYEQLQEALSVGNPIDLITADAPPELQPYVKMILQKGYKGGVHHYGELEKAAGSGVDKLHKAMQFLTNTKPQPWVHFDDASHTFQVGDLNAKIGPSGSSQKGAMKGATSRGMMAYGMGQKTHGEFEDKTKQVISKYPKHAQTLQMIFASPVWQQMQSGKAVAADQITPGVNLAAVLGALEVLKHEEMVGFNSDRLDANTMVKARRYGDATENDFDRAKTQFPQYAHLFEKIMKGGAWKRMLAGTPVQAARLIGGVAPTGGTHSPDVEQLLQALGALKHMGLIYFDGKKAELNSIVKKGTGVNPETGKVSDAEVYQGANKASDAAQALAAGESKPGTRYQGDAEKGVDLVSGQNRMHGGTAKGKMVPGALDSASSMHSDDPPEAKAAEFKNAWKMASAEMDRVPEKQADEAFLDKLEAHTLKILKEIGGQLKQVLDSGADRDAVLPYMRAFFSIADPMYSDHKPMYMFPPVMHYAMQIKKMYDGAFKARANVPGVK